MGHKKPCRRTTRLYWVSDWTGIPLVPLVYRLIAGSSFDIFFLSRPHRSEDKNRNQDRIAENLMFSHNAQTVTSHEKSPKQ